MNTKVFFFSPDQLIWKHFQHLKRLFSLFSTTSNVVFFFGATRTARDARDGVRMANLASGQPKTTTGVALRATTKERTERWGRKLPRRIYQLALRRNPHSRSRDAHHFPARTLSRFATHNLKQQQGECITRAASTVRNGVSLSLSPT